jgi:hypothetical protein
MLGTIDSWQHRKQRLSSVPTWLHQATAAVTGGHLVIIHRLLHSIHAARAAAVNAARTCSRDAASSTVEKRGSTASKQLLVLL